MVQLLVSDYVKFMVTISYSSTNQSIFILKCLSHKPIYFFSQVSFLAFFLLWNLLVSLYHLYFTISNVSSSISSLLWIIIFKAILLHSWYRSISLFISSLMSLMSNYYFLWFYIYCNLFFIFSNSLSPKNIFSPNKNLLSNILVI